MWPVWEHELRARRSPLPCTRIYKAARWFYDSLFANINTHFVMTSVFALLTAVDIPRIPLPISRLGQKTRVNRLGAYEAMSLDRVALTNWVHGMPSHPKSAASLFPLKVSAVPDDRIDNGNAATPLRFKCSIKIRPLLDLDSYL